MPPGRVHTPCRVLAIEKPEWWNQYTLHCGKILLGLLTMITSLSK